MLSGGEEAGFPNRDSDGTPIIDIGNGDRHPEPVPVFDIPCPINPPRPHHPVTDIRQMLERPEEDFRRSRLCFITDADIWRGVALINVASTKVSVPGRFALRNSWQQTRR